MPCSSRITRTGREAGQPGCRPAGSGPPRGSRARPDNGERHQPQATNEKFPHPDSLPAAQPGFATPARSTGRSQLPSTGNGSRAVAAQLPAAAASPGPKASRFQVADRADRNAEQDQTPKSVILVASQPASTVGLCPRRRSRRRRRAPPDDEPGDSVGEQQAAPRLVAAARSAATERSSQAPVTSQVAISQAGLMIR
jgi:hypothetical protein